jgi:hypothetical protein
MTISPLRAKVLSGPLALPDTINCERKFVVTDSVAVRVYARIETIGADAELNNALQRQHLNFKVETAVRKLDVCDESIERVEFDSVVDVAFADASVLFEHYFASSTPLQI